MDPKNYLRQMVDHTINGDSDAAEQAFKQYLVPKTMAVLGINKTVDAVPPKDEVVDVPVVEPDNT